MTNAIFATDLELEVRQELYLATQEHGSFNSGHEGWAIILEEVDELWEEIRHNASDGLPARHEAVQIAAMAMRYIIDVCEKDHR